MATTNYMVAGYDSTIDQYITKYKSDDCTFNELFFKEIIDDNKGGKLIINGDCILDRYTSELKATKIKLELTNEQYRKYRFNPKLMSYDFYGTTEAWSLLLHANELTSVSEFDLQTLYIYAGPMVSFITTILDLENQYIDYSEEQNNKILKG